MISLATNLKFKRGISPFSIFLLPVFRIFILVYTFLPSSSLAEINDPFEKINRGIFWFNDQIDIYFLEPIARGYDKVMPRPVKLGVENFFKNLRTPVYVVSDLVQLKFEQAGVHTARFLINSTIGCVGLLDVSEHMGMQHHREDFGVALGYHGVPEGPYIVIPLLGPSNVRDLFGRVVDTFLNPTYYVGNIVEDGEYASAGATALDVVATRADLLEAVESAKEASMDYYMFVQSTYHQVRQNIIYDEKPPEEAEPSDME